MFLFFQIDNEKNVKKYKNFTLIGKKRKLVGNIEDLKKIKFFFDYDYGGNDRICIRKPKIFEIYNVYSPSYNAIAFMVKSISSPRGKQEVEIDLRSKLYIKDITVYDNSFINDIIDISEKNYKDIYNMGKDKPQWTDYQKFIKVFISKKKFEHQLRSYNILKKLKLRCPDIIDYEIIDKEFILITEYKGVSFNKLYKTFDELPDSLQNLIINYNVVLSEHNYRLKFNLKYFSMYDGVLQYFGKIYDLK